MPTFSLKYQTADNIPAPYAHAIEINGSIEPTELSISFELTYLGREDVPEDELLAEGFSVDDDFQWSGALPPIWGDIILGSLKSSKPLKINNLEAHQDFWEIDFEANSFYPQNHSDWKYLLEEIQQAVLEMAGKEAPLRISCLHIQNQGSKEVSISASFVNRNLNYQLINSPAEDKTEKILPWHELNFILKNTFSGEFDASFALTKKPNHQGLFVNIGEEFWYEVGKSLQIQPNKILKLFKI